MSKKIFRRMGIKLLLGTSLAAVLLSSCGQSGPLYLPKTEQQLTK